MKLTKIISQRAYKTAPSFQSVFEWENIIAKKYPLKIKEESVYAFRISSLFRKLKLTDFIQSIIPVKKNKSLRFVMKAMTQKCFLLNKNTVPVIIDFWLNEDELDDFYKAYKHCPLVLITSAEIVEFLRQNNCPLNVAHWPLSISDHFKIQLTADIKKEYDFSIIGRPNPFFTKMLKRYEKENPDFIYIQSKGTEKNREYYTNKGQYLGKDTGRKSYIDMIRKSKITCYSTPGLDENKIAANRFNQVTPRLLEMIAGGCYVIGHYPDNPDTQYYKLDTIISNISNYEEFKIVMNKYRELENQDVDICKNFLNRNYTSTRVPMLKAILHNSIKK